MANNESIMNLIANYSNNFDYTKKETVIILAAGHGKRIKSQTSKMLHKIWEIPTVERVYEACAKEFRAANIIIVVGIKAEDVIKTVGKKELLSYAYQEFQNGTGHAVQIALENIDAEKYDGNVYVFPGDMGLINTETIQSFKNEFIRSEADMIVLTGIFEGNVGDNHYGRIIRVKEKNVKGIKSGKDFNNVIEIIEYKDIMSLDNKKSYRVKYNKREFSYTKKELIENREFNSGVLAFKFRPLAAQIKKIENNNVQNEIYLTDLISLFNKSGYRVAAVSPKEQYVLMGFNTKSVLHGMNTIARIIAYHKIKDIVMINDPEDFFIDEKVIDEILDMDKLETPLNITVGKGVYIGKNVKVNSNLKLMKNVYLSGNIVFGKNISIHENAVLTCFYGQTIQIEDGVEISGGNIIKGNVLIGEGSSIETGVRITGSDEYPTKIGKNVTIKGLTYIFGSMISDNIFVEHSVIIKKNVKKPESIKSETYKIRFYLPEPEGVEGITDFKK